MIEAKSDFDPLDICQRYGSMSVEDWLMVPTRSPSSGTVPGRRAAETIFPLPRSRRSKAKLQELYEDQEFVTSLDLDHIESVLK